MHPTWVTLLEIAVFGFIARHIARLPAGTNLSHAKPVSSDGAGQRAPTFDTYAGGKTKLTRPTCFIAMPISTTDEHARIYQDPQHWLHVLETLFAPAVSAAGFEPIRPSVQGGAVIHASFIRHLQDSDLVLGDLSASNPNVFFELGVRTALNKPVAFVHDAKTPLPFDTSIVNTLTYSSALRSWETASEIERLAQHIVSCVDMSHGSNPLWQAFGLTLRATEPVVNEDSTEAKLDVLMREMSALRRQQRGSLPTEAMPKITEDLI